MPDREANAVWNGDLKSGNGKMEFGDGAFEGAFSFKSRFENGEGTNPEELIAAAHAGCYAMAFSNELDQAGHTPDSVDANATVTVGADGITQIHLNAEGAVPDIEENEFMEIAQEAKENCPVSQALKSVDITLDATLKN